MRAACHQSGWTKPKALRAIGFLGGFTTFSTLGYETFGLFRDGQSMAALANMGLQLTLGLGAVACGLLAARWV